MHPKIVEDIRRDGLEFMGCYRAPTGICFFLAGRVATTDYRDKKGYRLDAWKEVVPGTGVLEHAAVLQFFISGSALATSRVRQQLNVQPDLLKQLSLAHLKRMLDSGETEKTIILTTSSPDPEFQVRDPADDPLAAQRELRGEILRELAIRHARGEHSIRYEFIRDRLCAAEDWIQRAVRLLGSQGCR